MVRLISANFVPVALNLYKIRAAKGEAGDFFRSVYKQKVQYQGLWVVAPDGKVLAAHQEMKENTDWHGKWPKLVLADLEAGIKGFGDLKPRRVHAIESLPHRGVGVQADGRLTLAVYDKVIVVKDLSKELRRGDIGPMVLDSVTLTAEEWPGLAPARTNAGSEWTVPETVARKFFPLLSMSDTTFRDLKEVTAVKITGKVQRIDNGIAYLVYQGQIRAVHQGTKSEARLGQQCTSEAKIVGGAGAYDIKTKKLLSLTLVWDGLYRNYKPYDDPPSRFGAVVEWSSERGK